MKFKFKAVLKNINTGKNERVEECIALNWLDALNHFADKLYKDVGDRIIKIEMVSKIEMVEAKKETFI